MKKITAMITAAMLLTGICASAEQDMQTYEDETLTEAVYDTGITDETADAESAEDGEAFLLDSAQIAYFYTSRPMSGYGYEDAEKRSNGKKRRILYERLYESCIRFASDRKDVKAMYDRFYDETTWPIDTIEIPSSLSSSEMYETWRMFLRDHPEFYWLDGEFTASNVGMTICVDKEYASGGTRSRLDEEINNNINDIVNEVASNTFCCDYERLSYVNKLMNERYVYARNADGSPSNAAWAHNIVGILDNDINTNVVCEGCAKASTLIFDALGINNILVTGSSHMWHLVRLNDGKYYNVDITGKQVGIGTDSFFVPPPVSGGSGLYFQYDIPSISAADYSHFDSCEGAYDGLDIGMSVSVGLYNGSPALGVELSEPIRATLCAAQYDAEGRLLSAQQIRTNNYQRSYFEYLPNGSETLTRVMLWGSTSSLRSLTDAVVK